jgi:hypothetical protein
MRLQFFHVWEVYPHGVSLEPLHYCFKIPKDTKELGGMVNVKFLLHFVFDLKLNSCHCSWIHLYWYACSMCVILLVLIYWQSTINLSCVWFFSHPWPWAKTKKMGRQWNHWAQQGSNTLSRWMRNVWECKGKKIHESQV